MELNPDLLDEYLTVLESHNVRSFSCSLFSFEKAPEPHKVEKPVHPDPDMQKAIERKEAALAKPKLPGALGHPSLWQNGAPIDFPRGNG